MLLDLLAKKLGFTTGEFSGGIEPPMHKVTADSPIRDCPEPSCYILPIKQHIGEECEPLVAVGDHVLAGQKIARSQGYVSVPIHAPTSGKVVKIEEHAIPHPSGMGMPSIFIEPDGRHTRDETLQPMTNWRELDPAELRERIRFCGLAGLGGAVFPTFIKLVKDQRHPIETVILNGIECEPWLTNDHRLMVEETEKILTGLEIIMHISGAKRGIVAIEDNKADAAEAFRRAIREQGIGHVEVRILPTRYPQGSEKQLIQVITGKQVPAGKLPMHIGVLCQNVATSKVVHDAILLGQPLTERIVTVSGDAMPEPANLRVKIGTPVRFVLAQCGLESLEGIHLLQGGTMMGERLHDADAPVVKATNGLLAMQHATIRTAHQEEGPCIRCGHCGEVCPAHLVPNLLADHCRNERFEQATDYQLFDCIECGCCSYVCPANIPLVHYFRYGKGQIAQIEREKAFADVSRARTEAKEARLEHEKAERAAKRARAREKLLPQLDEIDKAGKEEEAARKTAAEKKAEDDA